MLSAPSRGAALLRSSQRVCLQCARTSTTITRAAPLAAGRRYFASAEAVATPPPSSQTPPTQQQTRTKTATSPQQSQSPAYRIKSGIILTRPPLLTREQTPFESAFYLYQKRLNERLTAPFRKDFYFKKDTASDLDWKIKLKERHGVPAKDIGRYNPRGRMAWNDEVLTGSTTSSPENVLEALLADAEARVSEDGEIMAPEERVPVERPVPRKTEADEKNDVRRLDRALDRTLYLVVKREVEVGGKKEAIWGFPTGLVHTEEGLHETTARVLAEAAGVNMNTWIVGRVPVAHQIVQPIEKGEKPEESKEKLFYLEYLKEQADLKARGVKSEQVEERGEKIFYLKGRIMAGQADLKGNKHGYTDFQWLTQEELKEVLPEKTFKSVRNMFDLR
ncbi:39S mitochondrial ribosomal protein L46-domain-containing protein [Podospora australis]|uniref:Large ribosomal subunit protein mL46 n=1 Tax=Podospora australis TaxID=1536484 RepID=A0AAN6X131_9PEZI|nr:39S mitochondrial ribosomal protein L46-domain-containing protein [Podospora australis]